MTIFQKIRSFFRLTGTNKRIRQLKEIRQYIIISIFLVGLISSVAIPLLLLKKSNLIDIGVLDKYDKNIAVVNLDEQITVPYINRLMARLETIKEKVIDGSFAYVLIVASSPGGSPQGSEELAKYLLEYQKTVPTAFYVENLCASGCYYIASAMQKKDNDNLSGIIANTNSIVGSIGVVMPHFIYGPALKKLGMDNEYIHVGEYKVPIDSWSLATDASKKYLKSNLLNPVYNTFREFVQNNRKLSDSNMSKLDSGRVFVASLVEGTLVDRIGTYYEIRKEIKDLVQRRNPDSSVGFVDVDTKKHGSSLISSLFTVDKISLDAKSILTEEATHSNLNIQ